VVICSADEGVAKPDPAAFQLTLDRLGIAPSEAVFIDDTLGHVGAARRLGMYAIHYTLATDLAAKLNDVFAAAQAREH
jgi:HAD superfamily hydrolase (TIGR01509 family)